MSIDASDPSRAKAKHSVVDFLILFPFVIALLGCGLTLGIEPRMFLERTAERTFRVTGSNQFAGYQFYSKTIEGVMGFRHADGSRNRRGDSIRERQRQASRKRLVFDAANGAMLSWDREDDWRAIDEFMRGDASSLSLADPPPRWRMALSWFCTALGGLTLCGLIKNSFFVKKSLP